MKKTLILLLLTLSLVACVNTKQTQEETRTQPKNTEEVSSNQTKKKDFILDNLLTFNSEEALKKVYGKYTKRSSRQDPEEMGDYTCTLLFPNSDNEVEFVWEDDSVSFSKLKHIKLTGKQTDWKTKEGLTLGSDIKTIESLNGKPFVFFGFEWDYSGFIDWNDGQLANRNISGRINYSYDALPKEFEGLIGDKDIMSTSEMALKAKLYLSEITITKPNIIYKN